MFESVAFKIPNQEFFGFFELTVSAWFQECVNPTDYHVLMESLLHGEIKEQFEAFVATSLSYFDVSGKQPECFYHALILGMLSGLTDFYDIKSNREAVFGRYDVALIPKDKKKLGVVLEFKKVSKAKKETLEGVAANAMQQINDRRYSFEMQQAGIAKILEVVIAFEGKHVLILHELIGF